MLVLSRKKSEEIRIGDNVVIKILHAGPNNVKIGIEAPREVRVLRGEKCQFEHEGADTHSENTGENHSLSNVVPVEMIPGNLKLKVMRELKKAELEAKKLQAQKEQQEEQAVSELEWYLAAYA